ncbi:Gfo/Idh/MocA family protein [Nesterenkonia xinjiangensis]|uniref:Inositol 2-dehydrogenase n=1 Tax=Nesterenkonia xinjiangensis TaxID=225327 RepID=A0A7Z0KAZ7_9MICC|nr:Gfo/Idh/MocA family oxidoreductase [Nesterenkonia xinjiangensis]NYJ78785.1 myo-inositol 2-dehydrogenase/D-chiro-inositol 1-dehydrogenase [Nesterenkonia xinjiangensis]
MSTPQQDELRVAVVGAGRMGSDHVDRLAHHTLRTRVSAVVDVDVERAGTVAANAGGAEVLSSVDELLASGIADAVVLATPGFLHEEALLKIIDAGLPVLCEKPLTPDPESALRVVEAEVAAGRQLIQVGFMRRFDAGYRRLKETIDSAELGELLMLHHQHRNPEAPAEFTDEMVIHDSVVHEFDAVRYFTGEEITNVSVRIGRTTSRAGTVRDPQHVTVQTQSGLLADVEIFVNAQIGYQVHTQATFENGLVKIGEGSEFELTTAGRSGHEIDAGFVTRFRDAYDLEVQQWVDATLHGRIDGPSAWDGYATAACCAAGVAAQRNGTIEHVELAPKPSFYSSHTGSPALT